MIHLSALQENVRAIRQAVPAATRLLAVVKADAYGHGAVQVAQVALANGASYLAVATAEEGAALRSAGLIAPILMLGNATASAAQTAIPHGLTLTVSDVDTLRLAERCAAACGMDAEVHLKLDTGMGRIGAGSVEEVRAVTDALPSCPHVRLTGVFTHFARADEDSEEAREATRRQLALFQTLCALLPDGILRHCANSAAILCMMPEAAFDMVRMGIALYGYPPVETRLPLQPCMSWTAEITYVKTIPAGTPVSYGGTWTAQRPTRLATIACGYGDGYHRAASGKAHVLIHGCRVPVVGRICMDQMMADVTDVPDEVRPGETATLMGTDGIQTITADDIAAWAGTIPYEVLLSATGRVRRGWTDESIAERKRAFRKAVRHQHGDTSRRREVFSSALCSALTESRAWKRADTVAAYMPLPREADITPALEWALMYGMRVLLPRTGPDGLTFHQVTNLQETVPGPYGIAEPPADAPEVDISQADLVLVPIEAIDRRGFRLGKGGGYYDRLLAAHPGLTTLAVPLPWQWVPQVPLAAHDVPVCGAVVTWGIRLFTSL